MIQSLEVIMKKIILLWLLICVAVSAFGDKKALLIGNYGYPDGALAQPALDIAMVDTTLAGSGFAVSKHQNLTKTQFQTAVQQFAQGVTRQDLVVFYFSGHGFQHNGIHYLLPADKSITKTASLIANSLDLNWITALMDSAQVVVSFLDYNRRQVDLGGGTKSSPPPAPPKMDPHHAIMTSGAANLSAEKPAAKPAPSKFTQALCRNLAIEGLHLSQLRANVYGALGISLTAAPPPFAIGSPAMEELMLKVPPEMEEHHYFKSLELDIEGGGSYNF